MAATSALAISTSAGGEKDLGGLKWNTDMDINADFVLDDAAQKLADEAAKSRLYTIGEDKTIGKNNNFTSFKKLNIKKKNAPQGIFCVHKK